jgi:methionine-rich copper-binding protein CopC
MSPVRRGLVAFAAGVLGAATLAVAVAGPASAHSQLVKMSPALNSTVTVAPTQVILYFNENIQNVGDKVIVEAPDASRVDTGAPAILNNTATQALLPLTVAGEYTVEYRIVSADGHPVSRVLHFTYLPPGATPVPISNAVLQASAGESSNSSHGTWFIVTGVVIVGLALLSWIGLGRRTRRRGGDA